MEILVSPPQSSYVVENALELKMIGTGSPSVYVKSLVVYKLASSLSRATSELKLISSSVYRSEVTA
jgi:hypothetical protein